MHESPIERALLYIEPGPVVLVSTHDDHKNNVMTISWSMALDFDQHIAICTGPWNYSFKALKKTKECVICIPPASMAETVVKIGDISGADTDKFKEFSLTALEAAHVHAPLIKECMACLECRVIDYVRKYGIFILSVEKVWENEEIADKQMLHAFGDGTFSTDGSRINLRHLMADKLPPNL